VVLKQTALILNHLKPLLCYVMLCVLQSTSSSYILTFGMRYIVRLVWPPKGLGNRLVARGRKRLCTTVLFQLPFKNKMAQQLQPQSKASLNRSP